MSAGREAWREVVRRMPASVRGAISTELWRRDRLWELELPVELVPIASLAWVFDLSLWSDEGVPFRVTPNMVRADPDRYHEQYRRAMECDLGFPIHLVMLHGRWTVLDGVHRLLKADLLGWEEIPAKKLSEADFAGMLDTDAQEKSDG